MMAADRAADSSHAAATPRGLRHRTRAPQCRAHRGFTLIEVLVVLVIAGVVIGGLTLAVRGSGTRTLENAAQRARALVELACERAVLSGRDLGFAPVEEGLRFGYFEPGGWRQLPDVAQEELRPRPLGDGVQLRAERDGEALVIDAVAPGEPPFACLASGELTPFAIEFERPDVERIWRLEGSLDGTLALSDRSRD